MTSFFNSESLPMKILLLSLTLFLVCIPIGNAQVFYVGADLSYVNEMEACGVSYQENNAAKDSYQIFVDHGCDLVRLRLWHTPSWYDSLNSGNRYGDLADVKKSILRAKTRGMKVLLDFHLSDDWADPGKQVVPAAWAGVVDNSTILKDSLYQYVYATLLELHQENLFPEMVQIGNETNRGILLSQATNDAGWTLDWNRNSILFNEAIRAVRAVETIANQPVQIVLHLADPGAADWYVSNFIANGVLDFDIIGLSYYHQWHGANSPIAQVGTHIAQLKQAYGREVMVVEAGYPWTSLGNDNANNILNSSHAAYSPLTPANQQAWLSDLSEVIQINGGLGLVYWEPAWVSSPCSTRWGLGSHYENAGFFDFQQNLQLDGGIQWMEENRVAIDPDQKHEIDFTIQLQENHQALKIEFTSPVQKEPIRLTFHAVDGRLIFSKMLSPWEQSHTLTIPSVSAGLYVVSMKQGGQVIQHQKMAISQQ